MPKSTPNKPIPLAAKVAAQIDDKGQLHLLITPEASAGIGTDLLKLTPRPGSLTAERAKKAADNARLAKLPTTITLADGSLARLVSIENRSLSSTIEADLLAQDQEPINLTFQINRHGVLEGYLTDDPHPYGTPGQKALIVEIAELIPTRFGAWIAVATEWLKNYGLLFDRFLAPDASVPVTTQQVPARKLDVDNVLVLAEGTRVYLPTKADPSTFRSRASLLKSETRAVVRAVDFQAWDDYTQVVLTLTSYGQTMSMELDLVEDVTLLTGEHGRHERAAQFEDSLQSKSIDADYEQDRPGIKAMKAMLDRRFGPVAHETDQTVLEETLEITREHYGKCASCRCR